MIKEAVSNERGQAMALALAFMVLAIPVITSALALASTLTLDMRAKSDDLMGEYSLLGAEQIALRLLITRLEATTTLTYINGVPSTTTVVQLIEQPSPLPFTTRSGKRLFTTKIASPSTAAENASPSATTTFTITVENKAELPITLKSVHDELPHDFKYKAGTSRMTDNAGNTLSTADPTIKGRNLTWTPPADTIIPSTHVVRVSFEADVAGPAGIYCNEAYAEPGGRLTRSGKTAKVTVGSPSSSLCKGHAISINKTVEPEVGFENTTTTYTYTIAITNDGSEVLSVWEGKDFLAIGLTYVAGSVSSTPSTLLPGVPLINEATNELKWRFGGIAGKEVATGTVWYIEFKATGNLPRDKYTNEAQMKYAGAVFTEQDPSEFDTYQTSTITMSDNQTTTGGVASQENLSVGKNSTVVGEVTSFDQDVVIDEGTVVYGDVRAGINVTIKKNSIIYGNVVSKNGDIVLEEGARIEGDVWDSDELNSGVTGNVTVKGNVVVTGFILAGKELVVESNATIQAEVLGGKNVTLKAGSTVQGHVSAGEDANVEGNVTITGDVNADGTATVDASAEVDGDVTSNATVVEMPPVPPLHFVTTGPTAIVMVMSVYRLQVTVLGFVYTCNVWFSDDVYVGDFDVVDGCTLL